MPRRISKGGHEYAGRDRQVGEEFEVEQEHVSLLLTLGWIEPKKGELGYTAPTHQQKQKVAA